MGDLLTSVKQPAVIFDYKSDSVPEQSRRWDINRRVAENPSFWSWFDINDSAMERRLVMKLDIYIMLFAFAGYWILYVDRSILQNAYVSGMREDLGLFGNQFVNLNTFYNVGYTISAIPATVLITFIPAQRILPATIALQALFTILCFQAKGYPELAGFRFLVGLFGGPFFTSMQFIMGSWYRKDELVRRAGFFYISSQLGSMTAGLLAGRIVTSLNGALGHAGWRWLYLISAMMAIPIVIWGALAFPGTPNNEKRWMFSEDEYAMARERMTFAGRKAPIGIQFNFRTASRFFNSWHWWLLVPATMLWYLTFMALGQGAYTLWLKTSYPTELARVNNYTAINPSLGILFVGTFSWLVDKYDNKARLPIFGVVAVVRFIANLGLVLYDTSSFAWKWFAVATGQMEISLAPLMYSWANIICADDAEERAFVLSSMLTFAFTCNIWIPLVTFKTVEAPSYPKGYMMQLVVQFIFFGWMTLLYIIHRRANLKAQEKERDGLKSSSKGMATSSRYIKA